MKKQLYLLLLSSLTTFATAQTYSWQWAKYGGGNTGSTSSGFNYTQDESIRDIAVDNQNNPSITLDSNLDKPGKTNTSGITLGQVAFQSYRDLYLTLGHEFIHAYHNASGLMNYWVQKFGTKGAEYLTERGAYSWLQLYDVPSLNNRWENQFQREYGKYKHLIK